MYDVTYSHAWHDNCYCHASSMNSYYRFLYTDLTTQGQSVIAYA